MRFPCPQGGGKSELYVLGLPYEESRMLSPAERRSKLKAIVRVSSGNFLEMYDFIIYGYYATYIAATFFPSTNKFASLMATFLTFGLGFLIRPIGALVLGDYTDRKGRSAGLIVSLSL